MDCMRPLRLTRPPPIVFKKPKKDNLRRQRWPFKQKQLSFVQCLAYGAPIHITFRLSICKTLIGFVEPMKDLYNKRRKYRHNQFMYFPSDNQLEDSTTTDGIYGTTVLFGLWWHPSDLIHTIILATWIVPRRQVSWNPRELGSESGLMICDEALLLRLLHIQRE